MRNDLIHGVVHSVVVVVRGDCNIGDGDDRSSCVGEVGGDVAVAQDDGVVGGGVMSGARERTRTIAEGVLGCVPLEKDDLLLLLRRCCRDHGWRPFRYAILSCFKLICIPKG